MTMAAISTDRKTYSLADRRKLSPFFSLMCWNTVLQIKPVWLLTLSCSDSQKTQTFSKKYWHSYIQMKDKFAVSTHLICKICNLAGLRTSSVAWWSSAGCSLWNAWMETQVSYIISYTSGTLILAKERGGKLMAQAVQAPSSRKSFTCHFAQRGVFQGQKQKSPSEVSSWVGDKSNPC